MESICSKTSWIDPHKADCLFRSKNVWVRISQQNCKMRAHQEIHLSAFHWSCLPDTFLRLLHWVFGLFGRAAKVWGHATSPGGGRFHYLRAESLGCWRQSFCSSHLAYLTFLFQYQLAKTHQIWLKLPRFLIFAHFAKFLTVLRRALFLMVAHCVKFLTEAHNQNHYRHHQ